MSKHYVIPAHERAGLSRNEAAAYIGVSATLFDEMVKDGRMPAPRRANSRLIWSRAELESWFFNLPSATALMHPQPQGGEWDSPN